MSLLSHSFLLGVRVAFVVAIAGVVLLARPRPRALLLACGATSIVLGLASLYFHLDDPFHSQFPGSFYVWGCTPVLALSLAVTAWPRSGWVARLVRGLSVPACLVFAGATINAHYAYFPTLEALKGRVARDQVSRSTVRDAAVQARRTGTLPTHGLVFSLIIPPTTSNFHARGTFIYLPPSWFASPHPSLPVIMLIAGSPGTPADWTRSARADVIADAFADAHHGTAPILVMPDSNGSPFGDTECVDGPRGNAETYLVDDIRPFVIQQYEAVAEPTGWAVAGLSEGGTCSLILALRHPEAFSAFVDFGGGRAPDPGHAPGRTLFGPSPLAWASYQPDLLLADRHYPELAAWFEVGVSDHGPRAAAEELAPLLANDGVATCLVERIGLHNFTFWHDGFEHVLPWLSSQLGLTVPDADACEGAGGRWVKPGQPVRKSRATGARRAEAARSPSTVAHPTPIPPATSVR